MIVHFLPVRGSWCHAAAQAGPGGHFSTAQPLADVPFGIWHCDEQALLYYGLCFEARLILMLIPRCCW